MYQKEPRKISMEINNDKSKAIIFSMKERRHRVQHAWPSTRTRLKLQLLRHLIEKRKREREKKLEKLEDCTVAFVQIALFI